MNLVLGILPLLMVNIPSPVPNYFPWLLIFGYWDWSPISPILQYVNVPIASINFSCITRSRSLFSKKAGGLKISATNFCIIDTRSLSV